MFSVENIVLCGDEKRVLFKYFNNTEILRNPILPFQKSKWLFTISCQVYVIYSLVGWLVSLFNGISTLFRLFNAKAILLEER